MPRMIGIDMEKVLKKISIVLVFVAASGCFKERKSSRALEKMQDFVVNISQYARGIKPGFIIIPQNGEQLCFHHGEPTEGNNTTYLNAIDGLGVEELFYNGDRSPDNERINMLRQVKTTEKIMVSEYVTDAGNDSHAYANNDNEGFITFIRNSDDYDYKYIPPTPHNENSNNITQLADAQNYLYLISTENYSGSQDMINAINETNYDVVLIDLFFGDETLSHTGIERLKTKKNGGKRLVISYISVGSAEKYRYYWKKGWGAHHPLWLKKKYEGYPDEFWVKFWKKDWQNIIYGNENSYMKKIIDAGFDGAYLDNVEAYYFLYHKD